MAASRAKPGNTDIAIGFGFALGAWMVLCQGLGDEAGFALSLSALWKLSILLVVLGIVAIGLGFTSPWEWRGTIGYLRASRRWSNHRCPHCDHPMAPGVFDGPCPECGHDFVPPRPQPSRRANRLRVMLSALALAFGAAVIWHQLDNLAFQREVSVNPTVRHARARWWPASGAGFVYEPGRGISAHD